MKPDILLGNLSVEQVENTFFVELSYFDPDPQRAQQIVNTVAAVSSERISQEDVGAPDITVRVWAEATVPSHPTYPQPVADVLIFALGTGLVLGMILVLLLAYIEKSTT